jgi:hypothetical protein
VTPLVIGRSRTGNPCSWCLAEARVKADSRDSHGICERHLADLKHEIAVRRVTRYQDLLADVVRGCGG